jgi:deoxycytidylate deaminase
MMFDKTMLVKLMAKAYNNAQRSPDKSSQNGAILVIRKTTGELDVVANGYNHFYKGIPGELQDRDQKLREIEHAERACIYDAAYGGEPTKGSIMVCPWAACTDCARAIIGSGVQCLVYHHERYLLTDKRWIDSVNESLVWMENAGIQLFALEGSIPHTKPILVSGKLWSPGGLCYV